MKTPGHLAHLCSEAESVPLCPPLQHHVVSVLGKGAGLKELLFWTMVLPTV